MSKKEIYEKVKNYKTPVLTIAEYRCHIYWYISDGYKFDSRIILPGIRKNFFNTSKEEIGKYKKKIGERDTKYKKWMTEFFGKYKYINI